MKRFITRLILLVLCASWTCACQEDTPKGHLPTIRWEETSRRFRIQAGEALTLIPIVGYTDTQTAYAWSIEGETVCKEAEYTFTTSIPGTYFILLRVSNAFGTTEDEVKITVSEKDPSQTTPELPPNDGKFRWYFAQTVFHVSQGRSIRICPSWIENGEGASYRWTLNGTETQEDTEKPCFIFTAAEEGNQKLLLTAQLDSVSKTQEFNITVCPPEGTFRREASASSCAEANRVYAYRPAPGAMVNGYKIIGPGFPPGCTHEEACDTVLSHLNRQWMTSLGGWGGYLIVGFDHSITNSGEYDLCIKGNPYNYQSEPGIIWVSQDENGDGQPNDTWYELAGSEYGTANWEADYAMTYYRPSQPYSAVAWQDKYGETNLIPYLSYWNPEPSYWQDWMEGETLTFHGSRLASQHSYENGVSKLPSYPWGYADNDGSDNTSTPIGKAGLFKISHARDWQGREANLAYIDFVKVQTAQTGYTPNLGEISTEVYYIGDYHLMK